jgi:NAD(P)-dependent dehydrogenase (short-subunit alcohol dehydrogenase family)
MTTTAALALPSHLKDRVVLIFGGTSGIGLSAALQAKASGAKVIVVGSDAGRAEKAATEHGLDGWRAVDVTKGDLIAKSISDIPHVDHLVLMAGSFVAGKILDADVEYLHKAFDERIWAAIHVLRALGNRLAKDGSVVFISGTLADRPNAYGTAVLAAASAAMEALARGLALELAPIRVNTLSPGTTDTPLLGRTLGEGRDAYVQSVIAKIPTGRIGTAEEAGAAIVFLMSNASMNGETLHVDSAQRFV